MKWTMATVVMVLFALWQRWSGPTYAKRGTIEVGGGAVPVKLIRTHGGDGDQPVRIAAPDTSMRRGREARGAILTAAIVTLAVFAVPHSLFGSQIDWKAQ